MTLHNSRSLVEFQLTCWQLVITYENKILYN